MLFEGFKTTVRLGVNKKTGYRVKVEIQERTLKKIEKCRITLCKLKMVLCKL